jgi:hypothetical protein
MAAMPLISPKLRPMAAAFTARTVCMTNLKSKFVLLPTLGLLLAGAAQAQSMQASEAALCRAQLELLLAGEKLTAAERARFEAQCNCHERAASAPPEAEKPDCAEAF